MKSRHWLFGGDSSISAARFLRRSTFVTPEMTGKRGSPVWSSYLVSRLRLVRHIQHEAKTSSSQFVQPRGWVPLRFNMGPLFHTGPYFNGCHDAGNWGQRQPGPLSR